MPVSPWKSPGVVANVDRDGRAAWTGPGNAASADDLRAVCDVAKSGYGSWLQAADFGFGPDELPPGATIDGVEVEFERQAESADISDAALYLLVGGVQAGSNKASVSNWGLTDAAAVYGAAGDLWGATIGDDDVRSSGFGVRLSAANGSFFAAREARVDAIRLRVHYTAVDPDTQVPAAGLAAAGAIGSVSAGAAVTIDTSGVAATGVVDAAMVEWVTLVSPTGTTALAATAAPSAGIDCTTEVAGTTASGSLGSGAVAADQQAVPTGREASGAAGIATARVAQAPTPAGLGTVAGVGDVIGRIATEEIVTGAMMWGHAAAVQVRGDAQVPVPGSAMIVGGGRLTVRRSGWIDGTAAVRAWTTPSNDAAPWKPAVAMLAAWAVATPGATVWAERAAIPGEWMP